MCAVRGGPLRGGPQSTVSLLPCSQSFASQLFRSLGWKTVACFPGLPAGCEGLPELLERGGRGGWVAKHGGNDPGVLLHQCLLSVCSYLSCPSPPSGGPEGQKAQVSQQWSLISEAFTKVAACFAQISFRLHGLGRDFQPPT